MNTTQTTLSPKLRAGPADLSIIFGAQDLGLFMRTNNDPPFTPPFDIYRGFTSDATPVEVPAMGNFLYSIWIKFSYNTNDPFP